MVKEHNLTDCVPVLSVIISLFDIFSQAWLMCGVGHHQNVPACGSKSRCSQAPSEGIHQTRG